MVGGTRLLDNLDLTKVIKYVMDKSAETLASAQTFATDAVSTAQTALQSSINTVSTSVSNLSDTVSTLSTDTSN